MAVEQDHPLNHPRVVAALSLVGVLGIGLTLMLVDYPHIKILFWVGLLISYLAGPGAVWAGWAEIKSRTKIGVVIAIISFIEVVIPTCLLIYALFPEKSAASFSSENNIVPNGPSSILRFITISFYKSDDVFGAQAINVHLLNIGQIPSVGLIHTGEVIAIPGTMSEDDISKHFDVYYAQLKAIGSSGNSEVEPKDGIMWSFRNRTFSDVEVSQVKTGLRTLYIMGVMRYRDKSLPQNKWWRSEICKMWLNETTFGDCLSHNRTIIDD